MKRIFLSLFLLLAFLRGTAQTDNGLWTLHLSYHDATEVVSAGTVSYVLYAGNLLAYDTADQSVRTFDKLSGLSDKGIRYMGWSATQQCLVLLYNNNNIDLVYTDGRVVNIPQVKNYTEYPIVTAGLNVNGDWVCVSTTEGVILLNLPKAEVKGYFRIGQKVKDATVLGNEVYASLASSVVRGNIADNLYDFSVWKKAYDLTATAFVPHADGAYLIVPHVSGLTDGTSGICHIGSPEADGNRTLSRVSFVQMDQGSVNGKWIQFSGSGYVITIDAEKPLQEGERINLGRSLAGISRTADGTFWMVERDAKLKNYRWDAAAQEMKDTGVEAGGFGPTKDLCYKLRFAGNRLWVAGGKMDYASGRNYPAVAISYENGKWDALPATGFKLNDGASYRNVLSVIEDPADASHQFVSSTSGLLEFRQGEFVAHYNASNSAIEIAPGGRNDPNFAIVDGLSYDAEGNLWMTNYEMPNVLKVLKHDGSWASLYDASFTKTSTPEKTLADSGGRIWVTSRRTTSFDSGLYGLDPNGTVDDTDDDRSMFRSSAVNEDGTSCDLKEVKDICEDKDGQLWFGCTSGVYVIQNPEEWFTTSFNVYQPKVPRNDGTNYADYLLTGIDVTAVTVDGGNRKWLGTMGSGIYLVSPDGSEVISHFTAEDSPLLSNNINALAIHPETGELFIGTDVGLCSYRSHIAKPADKLAENRLKIYPNPVRPEFTGKVAISGLTEGAEVKVVSTGSQLVARGNAVGGTFLWDVCSSASGRRVAPGVYYLLVATADGKESIAGKLVVI